MKFLSIAFIFIASLILTNCDLLPQQKYTPTNIVAKPSASESGTMWGGDKAKVVANIESVAIECIPLESVKSDSSKSKNREAIEYEIAATASVNYSILDQKFFKSITTYSNLEAFIIFEAMTASGVVIGHSKGSLRIIENGNSGKASSKISGLSLEEIKRVVRVEARWEYGK